jgi:type I restriction enzyme S subunit
MREMKNSGIEYVGEIPAHWNMHPLYYYFGERKHKNSLGQEDNLLSLSYGDIIRKDINSNGGLLPESFNTYNIIETGDIIIRPTDLQNDKRSLRTGLAKEHGIITSAYIALMPTKPVNVAYYHYLLHAFDVIKVFYNMGNGVRQGLNFSEFSRLMVLEPPIKEQNEIADNLDVKCNEINSLSVDIQTQINTLEHYKRSIITEAVTKGLNSNAEMKDSGVQWIGKVPKSWKVDKLKYHLHRNEPRNPGDKTVLSLYRDYGVVIKDSRDDNHNVTSEDTSNYKYVRPGDFVINKMKAWQGSVAVSKYEGIVSPAYFVYEFTDDELYKPYFHYLLRSCYQEEFRRLSGGIRVGQWDLPSTALDNTLVLLPPLDEQKSIANYLNMQCSEIDKVIADKNEQLATIDEYKKSLIYEYVTGKKEVPTA